MVVAAVLAMVLAGCGSNGNGVASKSALQILKAAEAATGKASSLRLSGKGSDGGQAIALNIVAATTGGGGTIVEQGAALNVVRGDGNLYIEASASAWDTLSGSSGAGAVLAGKWWYAPQDSKNFAQLSKLLTPAGLLAALMSATGLVKGKATTMDGQAVIPVSNAKGNTLYVDTTGPAYAESITPRSGDAGVARFTQYNTAKVPAIPAGAKPLSSLDG